MRATMFPAISIRIPATYHRWREIDAIYAPKVNRTPHAIATERTVA